MTRWTLVRPRLPAVLLLAGLSAGCNSGRYPVGGRVAYEDGTPVEAGTVIGEATVDGKTVGVQGVIAKDGTFGWGTEKAGDGALPGKYKVIVVPVALGDGELAEGKEPAVDGKYANYDTSGLSFEVKPEKNEFNIKVSRPKSRSRGK
jgi:hypothetical protein